jgi:hypothetical protein
VRQRRGLGVSVASSAFPSFRSRWRRGASLEGIRTSQRGRAIHRRATGLLRHGPQPARLLLLASGRLFLPGSVSLLLPCNVPKLVGSVD